jgi:hypothetical protein
MKIAIAIPNTGTIKAQTAFSLCRMLKDFPHDYDVLFHEGSMLHVMRERLVQKAIDLKCTHVLFVDSDMAFDKDAVLKLIKRKKDIVGANYHKRKLPAEATVQNPKKLSGLTTCDSVATGFLLINLDVFKNLPQPWFFWGENGESEDFWFCRLARENGYKVWCDLEVGIKHVGDFLY